LEKIKATTSRLTQTTTRKKQPKTVNVDLFHSYIFNLLNSRAVISLKHHWRQLDRVPIRNSHISPRLIKLNALRGFLTQCSLNSLFVLNPFHQLVYKLVVLFFYLHLEQLFVGQYTAFVHDFVLFVSLNQVLGLFEILVLAVTDIVESFYHAVVLHVVLELALLFDFT
jgi:hypothetical protein